MAAPAATPQCEDGVVLQKRQHGLKQSARTVDNSPQAGTCGFRELTSGNECGCRKFWQSSPSLLSQCACGHHICFHAADVAGRNASVAGNNDKDQSLSSSIAAQLGQLEKLLGTMTSVINTASLPSAEARDALTRLRESSVILPELSTVVDQALSSQASVNTSYLPRVPSICLLPQPSSLPSQTHDQYNPALQVQPLGLGLEWKDQITQSRLAGTSTHGQHNVQHDQDSIAYQDGQLPNFDMPSPTRMLSTAPQSEHSGALSSQRVRDLPAIDVSHYCNIPGAEELIHSATEINTPSMGSRTPDFSIPPAAIRSPVTPARHVKSMPPPSRLTNVPARSSPVGALHFHSNEPSQDDGDMARQLRTIRATVNEHSAHMKGFGDRLELLERASSISQLPREQDMIDRIEIMETRLMDMETKIEELRLVSTRTSDHSSFASKQVIRHDIDVEGSNLSLTGDTNGIKVRMDALDERIADLEKSVPPSVNNPWEVEVILLPWGRSLLGLWTKPGVHGSLSRATTQDSEDWMSLPSSSRTSVFRTTATSQGWTVDDIHGWADDAEDWLVPKACSTKSVVYSRLRSRGFVQTVELYKAGAREIQEIIAKAFSQVLDNLNDSTQRPGQNSEHDCDSPYLGLTAPFIPLRKIHRSSELKFLSKSEMLTPALWTAEFLDSGVMMHAAGGAKRLFITHTEAYFQRGDFETVPWTWQRIRALPQVEVGSADIDDETNLSCWATHPVLDAEPVSVKTWSTSDSDRARVHAGLLTDALEEVDVKSESHSGNESEVLPSAEAPFVPITPVTEQDISFSSPPAVDDLDLDPAADWYGSQSDFDEEPASTPHPEQPHVDHYNAFETQQRYNLRLHNRTVSNPVHGAAAPAISSSSSINVYAARFSQQPKPKYITRSFSTPSNPLIATLPSFVPSSPRTPSGSRCTRRRINNEAMPGASGSGNSNKRRRIDQPIMSSGLSSRRQSRSVSASIPSRQQQQITSNAASRNKRPLTPIGPYLTPYSGDFGNSEVGDDDDNMEHDDEPRSESDGEVWEGLEGTVD